MAQYYRGRQAHILLEDVADCQGDTLSVEAQVERSEELTRLLVAIRTLPEREQEIIGLKFVGGLNNQQIGQAMGLRAGNVAVILYRALRRLRDLLKGE